MRAVVFDLSIPKYLAAKALGRAIPALYDGAPSCVSLREVPEPALPGAEWVRVRPLLSGVCGSDVAAVYFRSAPSLSPFASFPFVMGHEVLGVVSEVGPGVRDVREGDRVAIDPLLHCGVRGVEPCARCAAGDVATCERGAKSPMHGLFLGSCADLPGGFGEVLVAHRSQLFRLPSHVSDERGVLLEPLAVAVHAVLRSVPAGGDRVLVIGGGPIAYATIVALKELAPACDVTLLARSEAQARLGETMGADRGLASMEDDALIDRAAALTRAAALRPVLGRRFLAGGFDVVYDCAGNAESIDQSLRLVRGRGTIVLIGCAGVVPRIDMTHVWLKELRIVGAMAYGIEDHRGARSRTFAIAREIAEGTRLPLEKLVTHRFPLDRYRDALRLNRARSHSLAVKTVLMPQGESS